jgi:D-glycero-alpha-D-manno-heptose-7-phosphate kinase
MIISQTPLRVSLLGGGTDLPEWFYKEPGYVVGSSIDKYVYIILTKRFDKKIYIGYSKQEIVDSVDEIQHDLVREAAKFAGMTNGFEVKTMSDIPSGGSGLGSSSAILVGLLKAFYEYQNRDIENLTIAGAAHYIEREVLGRSVGTQDHYLTALGGINKIKFTFNSVVKTSLDISDINLYMFYTGITRNANDILSEQCKTINEYTELIYRDMANLALNFNNEQDLSRSIKLNWEFKKKLHPNITNPEIEKMCNLAEAGGAWAWKILGAGGGGFLLVYCPHQNIDNLRIVMKDYRELPFKFTKYGTRIIFNNE